MKKINLTFILISFIILGLGLVSSALCRGDSGYYYCKTDSYSYNQYKADSFKQVIEHKEITESKTSDYLGSERIKTTISEKTEIERTKNKPYYSYPSYMQGTYLYSKVPASSWRFKEPYNPMNYMDASYAHFYYSPRYDFAGGYYNWRW